MISAAWRWRCCFRRRSEHSAAAQTNLRVGLAEDPDILDPSMARTYVGRIVFASICDKLFDIDEKLNIVPQLALGHETSADGKTMTIKLRPGVKFHDGEPMDAAAAKYSLDRHLSWKFSVRKSELSSVESVEVVDPAHDQAQPQGAVLAAAVPAHRSRRHDGLAQGGRSRRRQVRPQAGLRRPVQVRRAGPAGPHRRREVRRLLEQGPGLHRQDHLPADRRWHGAPGQPEVGRPRPDGARARPPTSSRCATIPSSSSARRCRSATPA